MKTLSLLIGLLMASSISFAQNFLLLENGTSCDLHVQLYSSVPGSGCSFGVAVNYVVPSGASIPATAPAGEEWVYAEVVSWPFGCTFGQALDTDGTGVCVKCPGYGAPSFATVNTGGCNGCPSQINMWWTAYCGSGPGHIHFFP